jgi:hypothetical protein
MLRKSTLEAKAWNAPKVAEPIDLKGDGHSKKRSLDHGANPTLPYLR